MMLAGDMADEGGSWDGNSTVTQEETLWRSYSRDSMGDMKSQSDLPEKDR